MRFRCFWRYVPSSLVEVGAASRRTSTVRRLKPPLLPFNARSSQNNAMPPGLSRRDALKRASQLALGASFFPSLLAAAGADARINILYIMTDDHAAHALSCYGSKINETPNL